MRSAQNLTSDKNGTKGVTFKYPIQIMGILSLGLEKVNAIFKAVAAFNAFTEDNDPYGEHDCAVMEAEGQRIIWKIDYYDRSRTYHSPDAADAKVTVRVLTVMLSSEY